VRSPPSRLLWAGAWKGLGFDSQSLRSPPRPPPEGGPISFNGPNTGGTVVPSSPHSLFRALPWLLCPAVSRQISSPSASINADPDALVLPETSRILRVGLVRYLRPCQLPLYAAMSFIVVVNMCMY
jgi:hypothetical protein